MRWRNVVFMTVVLVFIITSPAVSQQWVDLKDPKALKALHSNKTFKLSHGGVPIVEHYRSDGKGIRISGEQREPLTWEVKGDQVCVPFGNLPACWQFQRSKKNPDEYVRRSQNQGWMQVIKVEDGIPEF